MTPETDSPMVFFGGEGGYRLGWMDLWVLGGRHDVFWFGDLGMFLVLVVAIFGSLK